MKETAFFRGTTKIWVVAVAIAVSLIIGFAIRGGSSSQDDLATHASHSAAEDEATQMWTCSMHPQIKLPKPGLCPICQMDLIPLETQAGDPGSFRELTVSENAKKLMDIETVLVQRKFVARQVRMVGKIDYDETRLKYITAWVPGRLDRLYVDFTGLSVNKGDQMVSMYSPELLSAQEELLQSLAVVKELKNSDISIMRETADATVTAVREKLRLWGLKPEQIAEIERRGSVSDHVTIFSPIGGIVIHKNAQEGMYVKTGTKIYTIADLSQVWIRLDAYESDLMWLRFGQEVQFTTEAYPGQQFTGTIAFIDPILTKKTRTVNVRVDAANPNMMLKPGMFVRAAVKATLAQGGQVMDAANSEAPLVIPASAAMITGTRAIVYVQLPGKDKPTFEGREIVLGPRAGDYYLVRHGLVEGERVVTMGNFKIDAELQIQAKPSMMTPEGGGSSGGPATGKNDTDSGQMTLPPLVQTQLHAIMDTVETINNAIEAGNLDETRSGFGSLARKIRGVDGQKLQGHMKMLWQEYSMLLSNDAFEGKEIANIEAAQAMAKTMGEHISSMKTKLGLSRDSSPAALPVISSAFQEQLATVAGGYLEVQNALSGDDFDGAVTAAQKMVVAVDAVDMQLVRGDDHMAWMAASEKLKNSLANIIDSDDIEAFRNKFASLSDDIAALTKRFGASGLYLYQFKCTMAGDGRGAHWLQEDSATRNPYYGESMGQCGEVIEVLQGAKEQGGSDE